MLASENTLRQYTKPDDRDDRLRLSFWNEYNLASTMHRPMTMAAITRGVVSYDVWVEYYESDLTRMLWIFTPPKSYTATMSHLLDLGLNRLMEIMKLPIKNKKTKTIDHKAVTQIIKAFQLVDLRVKGSIIQRVQINQQSVNYNADVTEQQAIDKVAAMSLEELEALDKKLEKAKVIEAEMVECLPLLQREAAQKFKKELDADPMPVLREPLLDKESREAEENAYAEKEGSNEE